MDLRVLKYFLTVAKTNNITKAAEQLHITQPTLSRQIMDLEQELDVTLFDRTNRRLELTKAGILFQQRATTLLQIMDQAKTELHEQEDELVGEINLGCVVTTVSPFMMKLVSQFQHQHPAVRFNIFDGNGDTLRQRIDAGLEDFICLVLPVEGAKYNFISLPVYDQWGLILRKDDPLANHSTITKEDLYDLPLVVPNRSIIQDDIADELQLDQSRLTIQATNNLPNNVAELVRTGNYYDLSLKGIIKLSHDNDLTFIPLEGVQLAGHVLAWRKNTVMSPVNEKFLQFVEQEIDSKMA